MRRKAREYSRKYPRALQGKKRVLIDRDAFGDGEDDTPEGSENAYQDHSDEVDDFHDDDSLTMDIIVTYDYASSPSTAPLICVLSWLNRANLIDS